MPPICAICGSNAATTKDHIPPKSLYPSPRDNDLNLNTVPACSHCNNGSSADDELFKVMIGIETGEYRSAQGSVIDSLARTTGNNAKIAHQIFSTHKTVLANLRGRGHEPAISITFDRAPYERVIKRIIRGLYWKEMGSALSSQAEITVLEGNNLNDVFASKLMQFLCDLPLKTLNKDTFTYRYYLSDDGKQIWGMQFFSRHTTFAFID